MVIDCETHIFQHINLLQAPQFNDSKVENLINDMDRVGVDKAILTSYDPKDIGAPDNPIKDPDHPSLGENPIQYFIDSWQRYKDRFYWFSLPDPRKPNCISKLEEQFQLGMCGLGELLPGYQHLLPNSSEMKMLYRFAADKGLPVILNSENWDESKNYFPSQNFEEYFKMMEEVFREFKDVRFMIGHGGGDCGRIAYKNNDADKYLEQNLRSYELVAELDNLWLCSCMPWWFKNNNIKIHMLEKQLKFLLNNVGFTKITWGSDWPWLVAHMSFNCDYEKHFDFYRNLSFCSSADREYLLGKSAYEFITGEKF